MKQITESSLSRLEKWMDNYDIACISACRSYIDDITDNTSPDDIKKYHNNDDQPVKVTSLENKHRSSQLKANLLVLKYGVTAIKGNYIEGFGTSNSHEVFEQSYFVVNLNNDPKFFDNIIKLGEYFNQDSIMYKKKGENAYLFGTNNSDFPGYMRADEYKQYHALAGKFMSRIKNAAFSFTKPLNTIYRDNVNDVRPGDEENYTEDFLFRDDIHRSLDKIIKESLVTINDYNTKQKYLIGQTANISQIKRK